MWLLLTSPQAAQPGAWPLRCLLAASVMEFLTGE
jgi:hypothetical protein